MLKHLLFDVIGHVSGLSEAQLEQIEESLPVDTENLSSGVVILKSAKDRV